jgi:Amt family ammonium transporter
MVGVFATTGMGTEKGLVFGSAHLLGWQALTALWVIVFTAVATYIILKVISIFVPLRMTEEDMIAGDVAVHGHEVYPSDVPSLGFPHGLPAPEPAAG